MLVWIRKLLENWIARAFFALLILVFVFWGISNVVTLVGSSTAIAHVDGQPVDIAEVQSAYQSALNDAEQSGQPDAAQRKQLASQALSTVLREHVLDAEEKRLGIVAPDAAIRTAVDGVQAFQTNGTFDQAKFAQVLAQNGSTPDKFIAAVRNDIASRQLVVAVIAGAAPPDPLVNQIFAIVAEQRIAATVQIPYADQPVPPPPATAVLQRYWRNHQDQFTSPAYRTIKLVILSPALLAHDEPVSASAVDAAFAQATAAQPIIPVRTVQVIVAGDLAASSRLEAAWRAGKDWSAMQAMAKSFGANTVELDEAKQSAIPSPALGAAVFAAAPGHVEGPIAGPAGLFVFKVTHAGTSGPDAAALRDQITRQLQLAQAQAAVARNVDAVQDALAGQTPLDKLPGNLGLVALQGTLDQQGQAPDGTPAPIPGGDALKTAIIKAAFAAHPGDPAQLLNGPDGSYFALTVDHVTPPAPQPFDQARDAVLRAWTGDAVTRAAEVKAASLLAAVKRGQSLNQAAAAMGEPVSMTAPFTRNAPPSGVTSQMVPVLFSLHQGEPTMLQTDTGFTVAVLAKIVQPTPAQDQSDYGQVQQAIAKSLQNDVGESFLAGLQLRDKVSIDDKLAAQISQ
jgi:peptidyl-prolyl cis-trans isomerase D